ncbi:class I SAM-dependent methyltransferase [Nocardia sp. XZ_19_385]|uniref:class I SAM-dependent methyltransferase n=1 Tax=Nocardia sp. XZ_19_385 TaxID=2769488 RepID=UPI00188F9D26|nr:class I SAM-dependent methyltransferase [Nocardia sp. XZ_19_385]
MAGFDDLPTDDQALRALRASSFGAHAAAYAEHRPDYPLAGIRWALGDVERQTVLDLGAGTGKLTEGLLAAGASVIAVEPDAEMRAEFIQRFPRVVAYPGAAESIPLRDGSVDAVVAGQAFHWFDPEAAFPEIARVLRPGGVFAAFWNDDDRSVGWVAGLHRVARSAATLPGIRNLETIPSHPQFTDFERADFPHTYRRTAESLTATIGTHSHTLVVTPEQRAHVLGAIADYLHSTPETAAGEFDFPIVTTIIRATVRP